MGSDDGHGEMTTARPRREPSGSLALARAVLADLSPAARSAVARCAVVGFFDAALYDAALGPGIRSDDAGPPLRDLVDAGLLEPRVGAREEYRVQPVLQGGAWSSWFASGGEAAAPDELRRVADAVARHTHSAVERLRALLVADAERARAWFIEAFDRCDDQLDLAGCRNLLDVLSEPTRSPFVTEALAADAQQRARRLSARTTFRTATELSVPGRYLPRAELEAALDQLLGAGGRRVVRAHGALGHGKSTLVRWFLARRCVPAGVACALVDLGAVDPVNATRYPWLLLLEIAAQLDGQLPGAPFGPLLRQHGSYRSTLTRHGSTQVRAGAATLGGPTGDRDGREVVDTFVDALRDASVAYGSAAYGSAAPGRPVVVAFDTFEEVMARRTDDRANLAALLTTLHDDVPAVRLVVTDRLEDTDGQVCELLPGVPFELEVPAFSDAQSAEYLRTVCHVTRPDLVDAVVARSDGVPWKLAVWSDVLAAPDLPPDDLAEAGRDVAWAVDRIVSRIEDDVVEWFVRFGTVPRRLTREFVEKVLLPRYSAADTAPSVDIEPGSPPVPGIDDLWDRLLRFAVTTSWLWLDPGAEDIVVFHPELRDPMHRLVWKTEGVWALLQADAARYYTELARRDPDAWAEWTAEAVYHRFQLLGAAAGPTWRGAVETARRRHVAESVLTVAGEILDPDYVDRAGTPRTLPSGNLLVEPQLLGAAHAEVASALARIALRERLPGGHPTWSRIEASLAAAAQLPDDALSMPRRRLARAALHLVRGEAPAAVGELAVLLAADERSTVDRCVALNLLADALREQGFQDASMAALQQARAVADRLNVAEVAGRLAVALAERATELGAIDQAEDGLRRSVAARAELARDPAVRTARARTALALGRPGTAVALAYQPEPDALLTPVLADAYLMLGDPQAAVDACTSVLDRIVEPHARATALMRRGRARAALLDLEQAQEELSGARELLFTVGDVEEAGRCSALLGDLALHGAGNLREAAHHLDDAERLMLRSGSPAWAQCGLLRAELLVRRGEPTAAAQEAERALDGVAAATNDPRRIVRTALAALCASPGAGERAWAALQQQLARIEPASARLAALRGLDRCPSGPHGRRLLELVAPAGPTWPDVEAEDAAWLDLRAAELMRVAGRTRDALDLVRRAAATRPPTSSPAAWRLLGAAARIDMRDRITRSLVGRPGADGSHPLLDVACAVTLGECAVAAGDLVEARELVAVAEQALDRAPHRITRFNADLADLSAAVADREGREKIARRAASIATAMRRELGEPSAAADPAEQDEGAGPRVEIVLDRGRLTLRGPAGSTDLASGHPLVDALTEGTATGGAPLARWVRSRLRAGGVVTWDGVLPALDPAAPVDLRIVARSPLAQLPWELATRGGLPLGRLRGLRSIHRSMVRESGGRVQVRVLQESLWAAGFDPGPLDGLHGPETAAALRGFQLDRGLSGTGVADSGSWRALRATVDSSARTVTVLQSDPSDGAGQLAGSYAVRGWSIQPLPSGATDGTDGPVDVVHLRAGMEIAGALVHLSLATPDAGWSRTQAVSVSDVDAVLRGLTARGRTPLVVLDTVAPPRYGSETVRRLLLRNDFAQQLVGLGHCYAVLATGLAPTRRAATVRTALLAAMDTAATADELARAVRADPPAGVELGDQLPEAATALFTAVAPDRMPHLARSR